MRTMTRWLAAAAAAMALGAAHAMDSAMDSAGSIQVEGAWSRALPPVARNGAAYMVVHNTGASADRIVGGEATIAERVELHTHEMQGELMRMKRLDGVELPAGGTRTFEPGALHVMLMGLKEPLEPGKVFEITLRFARGAPLTVEVRVKDDAAPARAGGHGAGKHGAMGHGSN